MAGSIPVEKKGDANTVSTPSSHVCASLKPGNLVRICECETMYDDDDDESLWDNASMTYCCSFCENDSSRVGVVIEKIGRGRWLAMFDFGVWTINVYNLEKGHVEVISE